MRYRRFGKTHLHLSVFSLGTMRFLASEEIAVNTVWQAVSRGVNHLETAKGYGKSEEYLGAAISCGLPISRDRLHITTKIPPTSNPATIERSIDDSLQRLKLDYLDCLAIHGINTWEHLEWVHNLMPTINAALADGRVRHIGFSTHGALDLIIAAINTDYFEFVNIHYYYFFQRNLPAIELAWAKDMGIFIISPADKGGQLYNPPEELKNLCLPLSPLALNYRFLLSDPRITTLSFGPANVKELDLPLEFSDRDDSLTSAEIAIFERLENQAKISLATDKCSQCYACLPCPENINIPEILRLRNLAVAYNMTDFGKYRYRMFENAGHWFPGVKGNRCTDCGECLPRCPENLDIPALLKDTHLRLSTVSGRRLWN
ncbi:oxidoreductase [Oscillatoriales cyanobacterium USR001]|nr:oxidoreductase [Oscillatoriales cyanobacterium USR001]